MSALERGAVVGLVSVIALFVTVRDSQAHGGHDPRVKVRLTGPEVRVEMTLSAAVLAVFDTDGDGALRVDEVLAGQAGIARWIDDRLALVVDGQRPAPSFSDVTVAGFADRGPRDAIRHLRVLRRYPIEPGAGTGVLQIAPELRSRRSRPYAIWTPTGTWRGTLPATAESLRLAS